jgi:hypothetical protein
MEIMENEESRKPEPRTPEGKRNPGVQVIEGRRRDIVRHHRGAFVVIIVVYHCRVRIIIGPRWGRFIIRLRRIGRYRQTGFGKRAVERPEGLVPAEGYFTGIGGVADRLLQLADNIGCDRIIGDPSVPRRNTGIGQPILGFVLIIRHPQGQPGLQPNCEGSFADERCSDRRWTGLRR